MDTITLPKPRPSGPVSVEGAIAARRTWRDFSDRPLTMEQLGQILWAAQGITGPDGFLRAAPSAGALYPMDLYAVLGPSSVEGVEAGVFHYRPVSHSLKRIAPGDQRRAAARACLGQYWMAGAPLSLVVTAEYERIEKKYGSRGRQYAMFEAGHICQNIFLQAEALSLAAGIVGAFDDGRLQTLLHLPTTHRPLLVMPVGYPAGR